MATSCSYHLRKVWEFLIFVASYYLNSIHSFQVHTPMETATRKSAYFWSDSSCWALTQGGCYSEVFALLNRICCQEYRWLCRDVALPRKRQFCYCPPCSRYESTPASRLQKYQDQERWRNQQSHEGVQYSFAITACKCQDLCTVN